MNFRLISAVAALFFYAIVPSQAQLAYTTVPAPTEASASADLEDDGPNTGAYKVIHGVVQNKQGVLPGATVMLRGTHTIVVTNAAGEFELRVPADAKEVELACGYGGLREEVVRFAPAQALGSIYLLHERKK